MNLFQKKIGPVFLKETSDTAEFIDKLQKLLERTNSQTAQEIEKQIKIAKYGEIGENNVAYELKTSGMDMYILHDIYLEKDNLTAQIDYLVITRKRVYVLECKNLIGNIEIDNSGNFVRSYELSGKKIREGIYSPITQNQRHLQVLKEIRKASKHNILSKYVFEQNFDKMYKSIVVLANPKTYLNAKYAPKEIKQQVVRADQLISFVKQMDEKMDDFNMSEKDMLELAKFYLEKNVPERADYVKKYEKLVGSLENSALETEAQDADVIDNEMTDRVEKLVENLKIFRKRQSKEENIKPYYIFNDMQMRELIEKNPKSKEELLYVSGFGKIKAEKYGEEIIAILQKVE